MFIGSIHRSDALLKSEKTHQEVQAFRSLIPAWLKRQICDVTFLEKLQAGYEAAIPDWTGPVWSQFRRIKHELVGLPEDVGWDRIAFTNIAKCHGKTTLVETCAKTFELDDFVEALDPRAVFICNEDTKVRQLTPLRREGKANYLVIRYPNSTRRYAGKLSYSQCLAKAKLEWPHLACAHRTPPCG